VFLRKKSVSEKKEELKDTLEQGTQGHPRYIAQMRLRVFTICVYLHERWGRGGEKELRLARGRERFTESKGGSKRWIHGERERTCFWEERELVGRVGGSERWIHGERERTCFWEERELVGRVGGIDTERKILSDSSGTAISRLLPSRPTHMKRQ
jgi:hypothetical protein